MEDESNNEISFETAFEMADDKNINEIFDKITENGQNGMNENHEKVDFDENETENGVYLPKNEFRKKKKIQMQFDESKAADGFKELKNIGRFWNATQIMGTRKRNIPYDLGVAMYQK